MIFSIRRAIRARLAPRHKLSCTRSIWLAGLAELRRRGGGFRESGAFLLGHERAGRREIAEFAYYDDLDPHCLDTGIVRFRGSAFSLLWDLCEEHDLDVVADVHTHPGPPWQSGADADHPMVAQPGHFSLIVPDFAQRFVSANKLGIYEYRGSHRWTNHTGAGAEKVFYVGWWG
jgi:proteasome lid subunit RPN8/RPN11